MGFIFGLLMGLIGGLLYAPKAGELTREELRQRSDELKARADELQRITQKMADDASSRGREIIDDARKQWDKAASSRGRGGPAPES